MIVPTILRLLLRTHEIITLSLSKRPSNFHVDKVRAKETGGRKVKGTENEEAKIERGWKNRKETSRRIRAASDRLWGSDTRKIKFSLCDLQLPVANKVRLARNTYYASIYTRVCASKKTLLLKVLLKSWNKI